MSSSSSVVVAAAGAAAAIDVVFLATMLVFVLENNFSVAFWQQH